MRDCSNDWMNCDRCGARLRSAGAHCRCCGRADRCDLCDSPVDASETYTLPTGNDHDPLTICADCAGR